MAGMLLLTLHVLCARCCPDTGRGWLFLRCFPSSLEDTGWAGMQVAQAVLVPLLVDKDNVGPAGLKAIQSMMVRPVRRGNPNEAVRLQHAWPRRPLRAVRMLPAPCARPVPCHGRSLSSRLG